MVGTAPDDTGRPADIFGEGEWLENKHKTKAKRKSWRKLHLGLDLVSGKILSTELTTDDVGDPSALPGLLEQIDSPVDWFLADGARTMEVLPATCLSRALGRRSRLLYHLPETRPSALKRSGIRRLATAILPRLRLMDAWHGKGPQATINAAG